MRSDGRMDRRDKTIVAFRKFANAPEKMIKQLQA
jgi:hypothetical protein